MGGWVKNTAWETTGPQLKGRGQDGKVWKPTWYRVVLPLVTPRVKCPLPISLDP